MLGAGSSITWNAPNTPGTYSILCTVTTPSTVSTGSGVYGIAYQTTDVNVVAAIEPVTINSINVSPLTVHPGDTITLTYNVTNPGASQYAILGASIGPSGTSNWPISDSSNDATVNIISGTGNVSRQFTVPADTLPGNYDLLGALWNDLNNSNQIDSNVDTILSSVPIRPALVIQANNIPGNVFLSANYYCNATIAPAIMIEWNIATGATSYDVYRNGSLYAPRIGGISFNDISNVTAGQTYTYYVVANNVSGSTPSSTVTVNVPSNVCASQTACTGYTYSPWSACTNGSQSRTQTGTIPTGCVGTPSTTPVLTQKCGALYSVSITPPGPTTTGSFVTLSVTLDMVAPVGGVTVNVQSSNMTAFPVPTTIMIPAGQSTNGVSVQAGSVSIVTPVTVTASYDGISVNTTVNVGPGVNGQLAVTPSVWQPTFTVGDQPATLAFQINNLSTGSLSGTISANVSWLTVNGHASYSWVAPESVSVTATPAGLSPGNYTGTLTITAPTASNSPKTVPVTMTILAPLQITTTSLPIATWGQPYSFQFQASGGNGYTWSLQDGQLPPALTLSSAGLISGTLISSSSPQSFVITIGLTDSAYQLTYTKFTLSVQVPITISTNAPGSFQFIVGTAYVQPPNGNNSMSFSSTGGTSPYSWSASGLPSGLSIDAASGFVIGTPTQPGTFAMKITATDSTGRTGSMIFNMVVVTTPLLITNTGNVQTPTLPSGTVGVAYNQYLNATGGSNAGYQWTLSPGALPPGLTGGVNPNATCTSSCSFQISGMPTQAGTFNFTLQVKDSLNNSAQQSFSLIINSGTPPQITTTTLPQATVGQAYTPTTFTATGGAGGYEWSFVGGYFDSGIQLSAEGTLSGTPTAGNDCYTGLGIWVGNQPPFGNFVEHDLQVRVTDAAAQSTNSKQYCLVAYYPTPQVTTVTPANVPFDAQPHTITVTGTNFRNNAWVYINGGGFVPTTYVNSTTLTFSITPNGTPYYAPGGPYTLWVVQPYTTGCNQDKGFTIN